MIDFSTLQGLTIPEGVVTEIKDESGRVLWALSGDKVILQVEKITSDTYAGEITYTDEQFILLDIYPKTNGTVKVTYGGLTKTITDTSGVEEPNAQQVFFGTFNGVSDSVATPAKGELTIKGDYYAFGLGKFSKANKAGTNSCNCIIEIHKWGTVELIPENAFGSMLATGNTSFYDIIIPPTIKSIGNYAFNGRGELTAIDLQGVLDIGQGAFLFCNNLTSVSLPKVTTIGASAFYQCKKLDMTNIFCEGLTVIEDSAFAMVYGDNGFTDVAMHNKSITLPSTITKIGDLAFAYERTNANGNYEQYCYLEEVKILATTPPTIGVTTFGRTYNGVDGSVNRIVVPKGCGEIYKAAEGWGYWGTKVVEES